MMNMKYLGIVATLVACLAVAATAHADSYYADSNQFGYQGTVQNLTQGTAAVALPTPRDGVAYFAQGVPGFAATYNAVQSNWYQHPLSNQNPGFFQINDGGTVTSAVGGWTKNGSSWDFSLTVTGANATYANSYSRLWQPDAGMAWGGTFTSYSYTLTATGMSTVVDGDGWRFNTVDPTGITGSFDGTFVSTQAVYGGPSDLTGRDTYLAHLDFNKTYWNGTNWSDTYGGYNYGNYSLFGAPALQDREEPIPEPVTMAGLVMGIGGLVGYARKRRKA
jgi:hypothetical protein